MKFRLSFRWLIIILFTGTMIPLLVIAGLFVYRLQQAYLLNEAQRHLINFVQAGVEQYSGGEDLTLLAVDLAESLRVFGADMFVQDAQGNPVPPALGTGPWLDNEEHQAVRQSLQSSMRMIGSGSRARMVYLVAVVDPSQAVLGSVEASQPMTAITDQLNALRLRLTLIITLASILSVLAAVFLSGIITQPIQNLVKSVEHVREGDLERRAPVSEVDEVGRLAVTYNQMLDRISDEIQTQTRLAEDMRRFAADASHELRSPLSVFRNSVELLEKAFHQDDQEQLLNILTILRNEVDSMTRLVENLLLLARLDQAAEAAASVLHPEEIHPLPLLEEIYERSQILAKGQRIELVWPEDEIEAIYADQAMVRRALNNIVENAITYTPAGKKIMLSLEKWNGFSSFIVEDEGPGIAPEQLPKIAGRFYRGDGSRSRKIAGTGLGLAIVEAIVRAHGGHLEVSSELGRGTIFRIRFKTMSASGR